MKALPAGNSLCSTQKNEELSLTHRQLKGFFLTSSFMAMTIYVLSSTRYEVVSHEALGLGYL
jgi:hypothetical protein